MPLCEALRPALAAERRTSCGHSCSLAPQQQQVVLWESESRDPSGLLQKAEASRSVHSTVYLLLTVDETLCHKGRQQSWRIKGAVGCWYLSSTVNQSMIGWNGVWDFQLRTAPLRNSKSWCSPSWRLATQICKVRDNPRKRGHLMICLLIWFMKQWIVLDWDRKAFLSWNI